MRRGQRQCPPNRRQRQSGLHRPPLCFSAMLAREFSVMVGLISGKAKSAIPQNSVGSRSRGWVEGLVCGSCHQLGNHSWWWEPPDSNRRPPACKARSGAVVTCKGRNGAGRGRWGADYGCPLGTGQDRCEWHASGTAGEKDDASTSSIEVSVPSSLGPPAL